MPVTIRDRATGEDHSGSSPESIVRRVWGRDARIVYSPNPSSRWEAQVVRDDQYGTHILAVLYLDDEARAARETTDLASVATRHRRSAAREQADRQALYDAVVQAVGEGMSESEAARLAGIDRMTVRKLLGK